jgi:hypothetical protein
LLAPDTTGFHAAEGTVAHAIAEEWLKTGKKPKRLLGTVEWIENGNDWFEIRIDRAMMSYVEQYVDWCLMTPGEKFVESRVDFSFLTPVPMQMGTLDFSASTRDVLYIRDLKYGKGVQVFAEKNPQLMIYALAQMIYLWDFYQPKKIILGIGQPRLDHFDEWETTPEELRGFGEFVRKKAKEAWSLTAPRVAGNKQCGFCRVKATCPALPKMAQDVANMIFTEDGYKVTLPQAESLKEDIEADLYYLDFKDPQALTTAQIAKILHYRTPLENWFKSAYVEMMRRANQGIEVPGYKMVEGRNNRSFADVDQAEKALRKLGLKEDDLWTRSFVTPKGTEDLLRGLDYKPKEFPALIDHLVFSTKGAPTLVPITDKRPPIHAGLADIMNDEDDDDYFR